MTHIKNIFHPAHVMMATMLMFAPFAFGQETIISGSEIPTEIQNYIKAHFAGQTIVKAEIDIDVAGLSKEYEIKLSDKTELEFNKDKQITKIDGKSALPESVIPQSILSYVQSNYPNSVITDWETEWNHQEVKLDNGIELEFTKEGAFIRIDH